MPAVKRKTSSNRGRGKATSTRGKKTSRGRKAKNLTFGEMVRERLNALWQSIVAAGVVGLGALAVLTVLMLFAGGYFWNVGDRIELLSVRAAKAMGFTTSRVTVKGGDHVTNADVMAALRDPAEGGVLGRSLLHIDKHQARGQIEALGWVEHAAVQKLWPNTLHISIDERVPVAVWHDDVGATYLIDGLGMILAEVAPDAFVDLPLVAGTADPSSAQEILHALRARPELYERVMVVMSMNGRRYDLRFRNDFTAKLPEGDPAPVLDHLAALGAGTGKLAATLDYIDLRDPDWAYIKPKTQS